MADSKISAAADPLILVGTDKVPIARSGSTVSYAATMAEVAAFTGISPGNIGRNLIHNPCFTVAQRGAGPWSVNAYTADRWAVFASGDTFSASLTAIPDASRTQLGDESARTQFQIGVTGTAGATAQTALYQPIEGVSRFAGKIVTVSFYAGASAVLKLGVSLNQAFGTGGSPSAAVSGTGQSVTLSSTYTRYSLTFAVPSILGKTLGTNGNDSTNLNLWMSAGSNNAAASGNVGIQSGTFYLWGVQLEVGSQATPLDYGGSPQQVLAQCQRFFCQINGDAAANGYGVASTQAWTMVRFPVPMRATPSSVVLSSISYNNSSALGVNQSSPYGWQPVITISSTSYFGASCTWAASADL